jgi:antitoxin MazE
MRTSLTRIGNSRGVIIPAHLLKQCGFEDEVEIEHHNNRIVISPARKPRAGWAEAIRDEGADDLLIEDAPNDFDADEWTW